MSIDVVTRGFEILAIDVQSNISHLAYYETASKIVRGNCLLVQLVRGFKTGMLMSSSQGPTFGIR